MSLEMSMAPTSLKTMIFVVLLHFFVMSVGGREYSSDQDNATNYSSQLHLGRSKRELLDDMPLVIKVRVEYATDEVVDLLWYKRRQYLANEHLPIVMSSGYFDPNVMNNVGEFVIYHDREKCSAVVYFEKMNAFFGYIGMGHFIVYLPYQYVRSTGHYPGVVKAPYVVKRSDSPIHFLPSPLFINTNPSSPESSSDDSVPGAKRPFHRNPLDLDEDVGGKHKRINRDLENKNYLESVNANISRVEHIRERRAISFTKYYIETLIFVTRGIADLFKNSPEGNHYLEWIVRYCIIYFSAVEMIFNKMPTRHSLYMNIAKIVIEDEVKPFNFVTNGGLRFDETVANLRGELRNFRNIYTEDSFDHVFVITSDVIIDGLNAINGLNFDIDLYESRRRDEFYTNVPITTISHRTDYADAVHAISRRLAMVIDPPPAGVEGLEQCSTIMQERNSKCDNCLRWSGNSQQQFSIFFSQNRNRCFLVNYPRSLRPPGPGIFSTPNRQCRCFGYQSYIMMGNNRVKTYVKSRMCNEPLRCRKNVGGRMDYEDTLKPFDGSICGNRQKVCWAGKCVPIESTCFRLDQRGYRLLNTFQ